MPSPPREYLFRPEPFGGTVYAPKSLSYFFVDQEQFAKLCALLGAPLQQRACSDVPPGAANNDISCGQFDRAVKKIATAGYGLRLRSTPPPLPRDSLAAPVRIYLEIGLRCNANCRYCLNNSGSARPGELSTGEMLRLIENLARAGVFEVRITGGEPTLRSDFYQLAQAVRAHGMALSVNSNLLVDDKTLADLIELGPSLLITSLDATEKTHATNRGAGFHRIARNARNLRAAGVPVRLNCMLSQHTLWHIESFIDEFAPIGCGFCFILNRPVGRAAGEFKAPPLADLMSSAESIASKARMYPDCYFSTSFHVIMPQELVIEGINLTGCNAIQKSFNVNSDGQILPCAFLYELSPSEFGLGNVRDHEYGILEVWRHSKRLRELREQSARSNARCIQCRNFGKNCLGSCVFMELYSKLSDKPDPYCWLSLSEKNR